MGRRPGSKNKPKADDTAAPNGASANVGHNSQLSDDEKRALTLHHKRLYEAADAKVEAAKADRKRIADAAKGDLGKGALGDIKDLIALKGIDVASGMIERIVRLANWSGHKVGFQPDMFAVTQEREERIADEGYTAGCSGETCQPPTTYAVSDQQVWIRAWHNGQTTLMRAFDKLKAADVPAADPQAPDTSEQPFAPPPPEHVPDAPGTIQ